MTQSLGLWKRKGTVICCGVLLILAFGLKTLAVAQNNDKAAQTDAQYQAERKRAFELWEKQNFLDAVPILEKLAADHPDPATLSRLGFALYATASTSKDPATRESKRNRAREVLLRSQQMGDDSNLTQLVLGALSGKDVTDVPFSNIRDAERAIREGEQAFVKGDLDQALAAYERALKLDPQLYEAPLYAGDIYFKKGGLATNTESRNQLMARAGEWFAKAISIDPNRETAYRYWGDALLAQEKATEAREKFVDAIVADPFTQRSYMGLTQWADKVKVNLAHPPISQPEASTQTWSDSKTTITGSTGNLDPKRVANYYWSFYNVAREKYKADGFSRDHPRESQYRQSLQEEAGALRAVAEAFSQDLKLGKSNMKDASLEALLNLYRADLIEAYVFFARMNRDIAQDYPSYREKNREKLRRYWIEFVIPK